MKLILSYMIGFTLIAVFVVSQNSNLNAGVKGRIITNNEIKVRDEKAAKQTTEILNALMGGPTAEYKTKEKEDTGYKRTAAAPGTDGLGTSVMERMKSMLGGSETTSDKKEQSSLPQITAESKNDKNSAMGMEMLKMLLGGDKSEKPKGRLPQIQPKKKSLFELYSN